MAAGRLSTEDLVVRPGRHRVQPVPAGGARPRDLPLLEQGQAETFLTRWSEVQARFVDDPQGAVRDGDSLVAELLQALATGFADHKDGLERSWSQRRRGRHRAAAARAAVLPLVLPAPAQHLTTVPSRPESRSPP